MIKESTLRRMELIYSILDNFEDGRTTKEIVEIYNSTISNSFNLSMNSYDVNTCLRYLKIHDLAERCGFITDSKYRTRICALWKTK